MTVRPDIQRFPHRLLLLTAVVVSLVVTSSPAFAVSTQGRTSVRLTAPGTVQHSTYTIGNFRTANGETVTGYTITFPSDTDVTQATSPGNTVVQLGGNTIRVNLGTPIGQRTTFSLVIGNIINPSAPGTYSITQAIFHRSAGGNQTVTWPVAQGSYTIMASPYIAMTIETPDPLQSVDFGAIDPGTPTAPQVVTVTVVSSAPYTMTRTMAGDATALGLTINGQSGTSTVAGPTGSTDYVDSYALDPPWTTDPGANLTATVIYTVTQ